MKFQCIGVMSGTSLDGMDIAFCVFEKKNNTWHYEIKQAQTYPYSNEWINRLQNAEQNNALNFCLLHTEYGNYIGRLVKKFTKKHNLPVDFIASHGHTIFHQPHHHLSVQIGSGAAIAAACGIPTICDFRSLDIALGGQGAPLVPIGDELLFNAYNACLNIGGISNISYKMKDKRIAYDISPANMILNHYARCKGLPFDKNGRIAQSGKLNIELFNLLNHLEFYTLSSPKSLGKEWVDATFLPLIESFALTIEDILHTLVEHIAYQIGTLINIQKFNTVLITGGGAKNTFLINRIQFYAKESQLTIPDENLIDYKEALVFAFLGLLRFQSLTNCLKSVTGAKQDSCGGCIYFINN